MPRMFQHMGEQSEWMDCFKRISARIDNPLTKEQAQKVAEYCDIYLREVDDRIPSIMRGAGTSLPPRPGGH